MTENQNPNSKPATASTRNRAAGWAVQRKSTSPAGIGQAVREWTTDAGPADYVLSSIKAVGVIEAKRANPKASTSPCTKRRPQATPPPN